MAVIERYRAKPPEERRRGTPTRAERRKRQKARKERLEKTGEKRGPGRPKGSVATTTKTMRRMLEAVEADRILPHEFFLMVIHKGLSGETLGVREEGGKIIPNKVTFEQMLRAAEAGARYFVAPIKVQHSGADGGPIQVFHIPADRLQGLDTKELQFLQAILPKLGSHVKTIEHEEGDADLYAREIGMITEKQKAA